MINSASVSKDGRDNCARGRPSAGTQERAPQDEVAETIPLSIAAFLWRHCRKEPR